MIVVKVFGSRPDTALFAGASIEVLHNFTLVHDDIMDNADTRRGLPTIHKKWDRETAILSGDTMMGMAYNILLQTKSNNLNQLCKIFSQGLLDVCEGQALDRDMEQSNTASIKEYLNMIKYKTARLIEVSAEMGALIATDNLLNIQSIKSFALNIGMAFQIQDDLLDVVGDETFGKKIGGDIIEGKKTYLAVTAMNTDLDKDDALLISEFINNKGLPEGKVYLMRSLYEKYSIIEKTKLEVEKYTKLAIESLSTIPIIYNTKELIEFGEMLLTRKK